MNKSLLFLFCLLTLSFSFGQTTYTWTGASNNNWSNSANWSPTRTTPAANDVIVFNTDATVNFDIGNATSQNIQSLTISSNVTLQIPAASTTSTLNIGAGATGSIVFLVAANKIFTLHVSTGTSSAVVINILTGYKGSVNGNIFFGTTGGGTSQKHQLIAADAGGLTFNSGSSFSSSSALSSSQLIFGGTTSGSVIFASGSNYYNYAGDNPFGSSTSTNVTTFQTGSTYTHKSNTNAPSVNGRTYANFIYDASASPYLTLTATALGYSFTCDDYTQKQGTVYFSTSGTNPSTYNFNGNVTIQGGTMSMGQNSGSSNGTVNMVFKGANKHVTVSGGTFAISNASSSTGCKLNFVVAPTATTIFDQALNIASLSNQIVSFTIQSDNTGNGAIGQNSVAFTGGNVTVQRYIGSSGTWRMIGFPFSNSTTISATSLAGFYSSSYLGYTFNESADDGKYGNTGAANAGWTSFSSGSTTSDKGILLIGGTTSSTINFTGLLNSGLQSINLSYSGSSKGWNLIANPFASNIDWSTIQPNNNTQLDNAIYRYDPNNTSYGTYVNGVSVGNQNNVIENGASFFVHSTGATSLFIQESDKTTTAAKASLMGVHNTIGTITNNGTTNNNSDTKSIIKLSLIKDGETYGDEALVRWGVDPATDAFDGKYDAYDLGRATGADLSVIGNDGTVYSIFHGSALLTKDKEQRVIALRTKNMTEGNYTLNTNLLSAMYDNNEVYLIDHYTNQTTLISVSTSKYPFIVTSDAASSSTTRFSIALNYKVNQNILENTTLLLNNPSTSNQFMIASGADYQKLIWQLVDNSGRVLQAGLFSSVIKGAINIATTPNVSAGAYFIKLVGDGKVLQTQKWIKQ